MTKLPHRVNLVKDIKAIATNTRRIQEEHEERNSLKETDAEIKESLEKFIMNIDDDNIIRDLLSRMS